MQTCILFMTNDFERLKYRDEKILMITFIKSNGLILLFVKKFIYIFYFFH